jgi:hypothetical protein
MTNTKLLLSVAAASVLALNGCGGGGSTSTSTTPTASTFTTGYCTSDNTISGFITTNLVLTQDTCIDGPVQVQSGASLTASGITIAGVAGSKAWIEVLPGAQLNADNVIFTSEEEASGGTGAAGQWGGVTLIGSDNLNENGTAVNNQLKGYEVDGTLVGSGDTTDSSGSITNCTFNNTGIAVNQDQEINGLSLVGVGSGTTVSDITVNRSGDDAVEIWGGHVNLTNVTIVGAGDDGFDTDDGWAGSVTNLSVSGATNSAMELSGTTHAIYDTVTLDTIGQVALDDQGGAIYLKKTGIGGIFSDVTIADNSNTGFGAIVTDSADLANLEGTNVLISGSNTADHVTTGENYIDGTSATPQQVADALVITL